MNLDDLRIRAMDGSVLVDGQFALHGDPAVLAHFAMPKLAAVGVMLAPRQLSNWKFLGFDRVVQGGDGLWAASAPVLTLDLGQSVPSLTSFGNFTYLPKERFAFTLSRHGGHRLGSVNVPLAKPEPDKPRAAYLQFSQIDMDFEPTPAGLRIALTAQVAEMISPIEGLDVTGLTFVGEVLIPALALRLQGQPQLPGQAEDPSLGEVAGGRLATSDLGLARFGGLVLEGQVDWGQDGTARDPYGPFVSAGFQDRFMGMRPANRATRYASGLLEAHWPTNDGPYLRINLGVEDFARLLEFEDCVQLSLQGAGVGYIEGRTGRDAYLEGNLRQDIDWLTLKLERSPQGLLIGGNGELHGGQRGQSARVGKTLDFAMFLPRKLILATGLKVPRCWDDWKRDYAGGGVW